MNDALPMWLTYIKAHPEAMSSFLEWITQAEEVVTAAILTQIAKTDDQLEAKLLRGELRALDKLRLLSTIADKEQQALDEHRQARAGNLTFRKFAGTR